METNRQKSKRKWREANPDYHKQYMKNHPEKSIEYRNRRQDRHPLYSTWLGMKGRCYNKNRPRYKNWGGRGICVCDAWLHYKTFEKWCLDNGWQRGLTIDRIDNNGNYEPSNCQIKTRAENSSNHSFDYLCFRDGRFCSSDKTLDNLLGVC